MADSVEVKRGLDGVVADNSSVSKIMQEINSLTYRGYPVQDLAEHYCFEEVAYLLLNGELPTKSELTEFTQAERSYRKISNQLYSVIRHSPENAHPMDFVRTGVSILGMEDPQAWQSDPESLNEKAVKMLARIPAIIAALQRRRQGKETIKPRTDLSISENFFYMCFETVPAPEVVKAFDVSLILYAEHGFNASTFTSRVATSTLSDIYSAIVAAIGTLKGPLHGGANEQVMHTLQEIKESARAKDWMMKALAEKRKIMGFGHRVYRKGDSRVPTMKKYMIKMAEYTGDEQWVEISRILEETMVAEKGIYPNLDFPTGPAYYMMGFDIDMFTPLFVMSRITGWCAHVIEQMANNRLIRPLCQYVGQEMRPVPSLALRG